MTWLPLRSDRTTKRLDQYSKRNNRLLKEWMARRTFDEGNDVKVESEDQALNLPLGRQVIDHLLHCASSVHVEGNRYEFSGDRLDQSISLFVGSVLEEALSEVVGEGIRHELCEVREDLVEDHVAVFRVAIFEFLLKVPATELIFAQREHICRGESRRFSKVARSQNSRERIDQEGKLTSLEIFEPESSKAVRTHSTRVSITSRSESAARSSTVVNEGSRIMNISSGTAS